MAHTLVTLACSALEEPILVRGGGRPLSGDVSMLVSDGRSDSARGGC